MENSEAEAALWFSSLELDNIQVLYVYGVGLGYVYDAAEKWLRDDKLRSLVFLEDIQQVIQRLLETERGNRLLKDPQVTLCPISEQLSELNELVMPYSVFSFTVSCSEAYAHRKHQFAEIKGIISFFADYHRASIFGHAQGGLFFFNNYFNNILKLPSAYNAESLSGKFKGIPAIICGAGPSLDKNIEVLRKLHSRALIFAGATAINALNAKGVVPHVGVGIDPNVDQLTRLIMNQGYEMPFFYRNRINHKALEMIHSDKICISGSCGFEISRWMEKKLGLKENHLSEGYNVLNFALSQAHIMGCNPIIMVGVDLAYSNGQSYASGINSHPLHDRKVNFRTKSAEEEVLDKKDIYGQPVRTLWKWIREALWYGLFAQDHPDVLLINATEGGIGFPDVRNMTLTDVAAQHLVQHYDIPTRLHGEIQNSQWPQEVREANIIALLGQLSESLKRCVEKCERIEAELSLIAQSNSEAGVDRGNTSMNKIIEELKAEEAFKAMLRDIEESSLRFTSLERQRLKVGKEEIPEDEIASRQNALDVFQYGLLKKTAHNNALLIDSILSNHKARKMTLQSQSKIQSFSKMPSQSTEDEIYTFDEQYLTLQDPELDLDYSETFPTGSYLRKERVFYPDGKVKSEQFYQGIFLHGPSTFFSQDGKVLAKAWFLNGQQQGKMWTYFAGGQRHSVQRFRDGQKHGKQEFFYRDGTLKTILNYLFGRLDGAAMLYHASGREAREQHFVDGQLEGMERIWNENGQLEIEVEYHQNRPIGEARQWHSNGQRACEITYDADSHRISAHYWDVEGIPISENERESGNYFEMLSKNTGDMTHSLENVLSQVITLMPTLTSTHVPHNGKMEPDFTDDLKELQNEMARLQGLSQALERESTKGNALESGLDPANQLAFEQQLLLRHRKMTDQMQSIDQGLKDMLKGLLQNNEDDQK